MNVLLSLDRISMKSPNFKTRKNLSCVALFFVDLGSSKVELSGRDTELLRCQRIDSMFVHVTTKSRNHQKQTKIRPKYG